MKRFSREGEDGSIAEHAGPFTASFNEQRVEDQGSLSGPEDDAGTYLVAYPDTNKMDADIDDEPNNSLTSQTLNADGTPKRPMNAFMIFARRRRPQVSAENQSMRTGEVSKILSREWNAMNSSEKQFYLNQAKQLKDNFNLKYPDYVYRRRPNNSRKKRRGDSTGVAADSISAVDSVHEQSPEYGEISPVDYNDSQERYGSSVPEHQYSSTPAEATYDASYLSAARSSSYQPVDSLPYHAYSESNRRVSYIPSQGGVTSDVVMGPSTPSASRGTPSTPYYPSFVPNASHAQPASYFPSQSESEGQWHPSNHSSHDALGRLPPQSWSQSGPEQSLHAGDDRHHQYQLPQASPASWVNSSPSEPVTSNNSPVHASSYGFPTLTSPFYPPQSGSHNIYPAQHSPPQMPDGSHHYCAVSHAQGGSPASRQEAAYHDRQYSQVPAMQTGYLQSGGSTMLQYHTQSRNVLLSIPMPPTHPVSMYSHSQSTTPGSGTDSSSQLH